MRIGRLTTMACVLSIAIALVGCGSAAPGASSSNPTVPVPSAAASPISDDDGIVPVSAAHPSEEAEAVFAKCHIGDQIPIEQVAAMGKVPAAADLAHYVPLTGREPQLLEAGPAWVVEVRAEIPQPASREVWIDPTCVVTASSSGYFATGPVRDVRSGSVMTPAPPQFPPDRTLPPLAP